MKGSTRYYWDIRLVGLTGIHSSADSDSGDSYFLNLKQWR